MVGQILGIEWARNNLTNIIKKSMYDEEDD
jgi:hypothetical protein